jgi:hypothetical protein
MAFKPKSKDNLKDKKTYSRAIKMDITKNIQLKNMDITKSGKNKCSNLINI